MELLLLLVGLVPAIAMYLVWRRHNPGLSEDAVAQIAARIEATQATVAETNAQLKFTGDRVMTGLENDGKDQALIKEALATLQSRIERLDKERSNEVTAMRASLVEQVQAITQSTEHLRKETASLSSALRKPQVRGAWGELQLRNAVEAAGMSHRCDFAEQVTYASGSERPDMVINLPQGHRVIVDSKVPLEGFQDACQAETDADRERHMKRHADHVRKHVDSLAKKEYWRSEHGAADFVVMYLPSEAFLSAALDVDPSLLERGFAANVIITTPTTIIGLLKTVAYSWTSAELTDQVREIQELGKTLVQRLDKVGSHFGKVGRSLTAAVTAYNRAIGSLERNYLTTARAFSDKVGGTHEHLEWVAVEDAPRQLTKPELIEDELDAIAAPREEIIDFEAPGVAPLDKASGDLA